MRICTRMHLDRQNNFSSTTSNYESERTDDGEQSHVGKSDANSS